MGGGQFNLQPVDFNGFGDNNSALAMDPSGIDPAFFSMMMMGPDGQLMFNNMAPNDNELSQMQINNVMQGST